MRDFKARERRHAPLHEMAQGCFMPMARNTFCMGMLRTT
jgi:hypothetical protein